jgi:hypothetical protein
VNNAPFTIYCDVGSLLGMTRAIGRTMADVQRYVIERVTEEVARESTHAFGRFVDRFAVGDYERYRHLYEWDTTSGRTAVGDPDSRLFSIDVVGEGHVARGFVRFKSSEVAVPRPSPEHGDDKRWRQHVFVDMAPAMEFNRSFVVGPKAAKAIVWWDPDNITASTNPRRKDGSFKKRTASEEAQLAGWHFSKKAVTFTNETYGALERLWESYWGGEGRVNLSRAVERAESIVAEEVEDYLYGQEVTLSADRRVTGTIGSGNGSMFVVLNNGKRFGRVQITDILRGNYVPTARGRAMAEEVARRIAGGFM